MILSQLIEIQPTRKHGDSTNRSWGRHGITLAASSRFFFRPCDKFSWITLPQRVKAPTVWAYSSPTTYPFIVDADRMR